MAKRTVRVPGDSWKRVLEAVRKLQEMHRLGRELLEKYPIGQTSGQRAMQREAAERETNTDKLFKARAFADPEKGYSPTELSRLCDTCKKYRRALGFAFITRLLTVHDRPERAKLQRRVIVERWSLIELKLELVSRYGHRRRAGKRPKINDVPELLAELGTRAIWWRRLYDMLDLGDQTRPSTLSLADIPDEIRRPFSTAVEAIKRLENVLLEASEGGRQHKKRASGGTDRPGKRTTTPSSAEPDDGNRIRRIAKAAALLQKASSIRRG